MKSGSRRQGRTAVGGFRKWSVAIHDWRRTGRGAAEKAADRILGISAPSSQARLLPNHFPVIRPDGSEIGPGNVPQARCRLVELVVCHFYTSPE